MAASKPTSYLQNVNDLFKKQYYEPYHVIWAVSLLTVDLSAHSLTTCFNISIIIFFLHKVKDK